MPQTRKPTAADAVNASQEEAALRKLEVKTLHDIETKSVEELTRWLVLFHGYQVRQGTPDEEIRLACASLLGVDYAPRLKVKGDTGDPSESDYCNLFIYPGTSSNDQSHVYLCVNGRSALVRRGVNVRCPKYLLPAITDAVMTEYDHDPILKTTTPRDIHTFPHSIT